MGRTRGGSVRRPTMSAALNRAFVFLKPHAMTPQVQDFVRESLKSKMVSIAGEGRIDSEQIDKGMLIDKHYYAIASKATLLKPDKLPVPETKFKEKFGLDWSSVLASGRALNARDACEMFGVDAAGLFRMWNAAKDAGYLVKFSGGFYCAKLDVPEKGTYYVLNGFFMEMRNKYVVPGASVYYYLAEWSPLDLSWSDFRQQVLGPTDPAAAPGGSIRGSIFAKWRDFGLQCEPNISDNGVHASASPIEALFERMNWLDIPMEFDPFGQWLLDHDVTPKMIEEWRRDPQVTYGKGQQKAKGSLYDALEDLDADRCILKCQDIAKAGHTHATVVKNRAFVFIKPHAVTRQVRDYVRGMLEDKGIRIMQEGVIEAEQINRDMLVDKHYYAIASKATLLTPDKLSVPRDKFKEKFGVSFEDALVAGNVVNAKDACSRLDFTAAELGAVWNTAKKAGHLVKFSGGFYCAKLDVPEKGTYYVFNGFFMEMREKFVKPGSEIYYFLAEWDPVSLSWAEFRGGLLGPTDPATAPPGSIRGALYRNWEALGLRAQPDMSDNGVHASASPVEALFERMNWLGINAEQDPFGSLLLEAGVSKATIEEWSKDPQVRLNYSRATCSFYDFMEDKDGDVCLEECIVVSRAGHTPLIVRNTAFIFVKPHAITDKTKDLVRDNLKSKDVRVLREGVIDAAMIDKDMLIDKHYYAIASKATLVTPDQLPVPKEKFQAAFGVAWEDALKTGFVVNAKEACERMKLDASGLGAVWAQAKKDGNLVKFGGGFYCAKIERALEDEGRVTFFVFNGFFMEMRNKYVAPGASIHYFLVEWDPLDLSWSDFRGQVLGPTDPATAPSDSLRGLIYSRWEALGLSTEPNISDNGVHASASPFEALSEQMNWLGTKPEEDDFGQLLLEGGVTLKNIQDWALDPQVTFVKQQKSITCSLYDALEDLDADRCVTQCQLIVGSSTTADAGAACELTGDAASELQKACKNIKTVVSETFDAYVFKYYVRDPDACGMVWEVTRRQERLANGMYAEPTWLARKLTTTEVAHVLGNGATA